MFSDRHKLYFIHNRVRKSSLSRKGELAGTISTMNMPYVHRGIMAQTITVQRIMVKHAGYKLWGGDHREKF